MDVEFLVELRKDSPLITVRMEADNHAKDHRVRVLIPNNLGTEFSESDNQFATIRRPVVDSAMEVWEEEKWSERPDSIYPFLSFVRQENEKGLGVITDSVREYELTGENYNTIALTMFRCVGVLGKETLYRRPGRPSGIKMETPDSRMQGKQHYTFALTADCRHISRRASEYTTPLVSYNKMPYNAMKLNQPTVNTPYSYSLLKINSEDITLSVLKKEENGTGLLFQCYNATNRTEEGCLTSLLHLMGETMLDETRILDCSCTDILRLEPNQTKTVLLKEERM